MQYEFNDKGFYTKSTFEIGDYITIWENDGFLKRNSYYIKSMNDEEVVLEATIPSIEPDDEVRKIMSYEDLTTRIRLYLINGTDRDPEGPKAEDIEIAFADHELEEVQEELRKESEQLALF